MAKYEQEGKISFGGDEYVTFRAKEEKESVTQSAQDEAERWEVPVGGSIGTNPTIYNNKIYFGACDKHFYCLSLDGKLIWKYLAGGPILSSASIRDGTVFFGCNDGYFFALDAETGELKWKFLTGGDIYSSPAVIDDKIYFGSGDRYLYVLDMDGKLLWKFLTGGRITASPAVVNDAVFFTSYDRKFYSISTDGKILWEFLLKGPTGSSPTIANEKFEEVWSLHKYSAKDPGKISVKNGTLYFGSWDNHRYAVDLDTGKLIWQFITGGMTSSAAILYRKILFFGSFDTYFYALGSKKGNLLWKVKTGNLVSYQKPLIYDDMIYFGSGDQHLYALSLGGKESWKFMTGGYVISAPVAHKNVIYFGSWDTYFYAVDIKTRNLLWKFQTGFPFMSPVKDIVDRVVKVTEKRFTTWKPEIVSPTGKIYKPDTSGSLLDTSSEPHPYTMKPKYTMDSPYTLKKKKKDNFLPGGL